MKEGALFYPRELFPNKTRTDGRPSVTIVCTPKAVGTKESKVTSKTAAERPIYTRGPGWFWAEVITLTAETKLISPSPIGTSPNRDSQ